MAHYLSIWIFNVYMLLNIDCIVFSGGLLAMGDKLLGRMKEEFERYHTNEVSVDFFRRSWEVIPDLSARLSYYLTEVK